MVSKAQKVRLGIFLTISSTILFIMLFMVAGSKLTEKLDTYYIAYDDLSVNGLQIGGQVKYHGIQIGRVEEINIDSENIQRVVVTLKVKEGTPIKEDVKAQMVMVGITGLKQIELLGGTNLAKTLPSESYIKAGSSAFDSITGKAEDIAEKIETILNNVASLTDKENQGKIKRILANVDNLLEENRRPIHRIVSNADSLTLYLAQLTKETNSAISNVNAIIESPQIMNILNNSEQFTGKLAAADIESILNDLQNTIQTTNRMVRTIDITVLKGRQDLLETLEQVRESAENLNEFSQLIIENPSYLIRGKSDE